jgi:kynureninase
MNDTNDPLKHYRDRFFLPQGVIYLDGNSLGAMPKTAPRIMQNAVQEEWATGLIRSWNRAGWWQLPVQLGDRIGGLIGAREGQTIVTDSTTINIYKALHAAVTIGPNRAAIIAESDAFPTDLYISESFGDKFERRLIGPNVQNLEQMLDENVAAVLLSHVDYRTGQLLDMQAITKKVQAAGALMIWDLCHTAGVVPMQLDDWNVDFAVGCTYKYLNGGPGSPAFIYAAKRHHGNIKQPLTGWWAHAQPFEFKQQFVSDGGIRSFLCGTQPILSMRALCAALEITDGIDMQQVRQKSKALTTLFADLVMEKCSADGLGLVSPDDANQRGSQIALTHENAYEIMQALIARGVIGDVRQPNILRFGFAPLYTSFDDVRNAAQILADILQTGDWKDGAYTKRNAVT